MSSATRKPPIQYGKKAQRSNAKRVSMPIEIMRRKEDSSPFKPSPQRTIPTKINTPTPAYRSQNSPKKAGPSRKRVATSDDGEDESTDESPDELDDEPQKVRPQSRGADSTNLLASTLKRKVTLEEVSSGVESDDTLRLGYIPRKKTKVDVTPLILRTPTKKMAYVEVPSPRDLFGPNHKTPHTGSENGGASSSKAGPPNTIFMSSPNDASNDSRPPSPSERTPKKLKLASRPGTSKDFASRRSPATSAKSTPRGSPAQAGSPGSLAALSNSPSPKKPPPGVARRMLSRTDSFPVQAIDDIPTSRLPIPITPERPPLIKPTATDIPSHNNSFTKQSHSPNVKSADPSPSSISAPQDPSPFPSRPVARTYAKSRSFLVDLSSSILEPGSQTTEVRESYSDLRARWGMDAMENETQEHGLLPNDLKSVTELMNKGETRRFMDEVGYLFEGLGPKQSLSVRRSTAVELVTKVADSDFMRRARVTDILGRAWDGLRSHTKASSDVVLDVCCLSFIALTSRDSRSLDDLRQRDGFVALLSDSLSKERSNDPLTFASDDANLDDAKRVGVGKSERRMLQTIYECVALSDGLLPKDALPSSRLLASMVISRLSNRRQSLHLFDALLRSMISELALASIRVTRYLKGVPLLPSAKEEAPRLHHVQYCLHEVERTLFGHHAEEARLTVEDHKEDLSNGLVTLAVFCEVIMAERLTLTEVALQCFNTTFQVLIGLCQSPAWADGIASSPFGLAIILRTALAPIDIPFPISKDSSSDALSSDPPTAGSDEPHLDAQAVNVDMVCYALALLTNILQHDPSVADVVGKFVLGPTCPRTRLCIKTCHCPKKRSALRCFVELYETPRDEVDETAKAQADFFKGHLGVMLLLLTSSTDNRVTIFEAFSGDSLREKIDALIEVVRDFVGLHQEVTKRMTFLIEDTLPEQPDSNTDDKPISDDVANSRVHARTESPAFINHVALANTPYSDNRDHEAVERLIAQLQEWRDGLNT